MQRLMCKGKIHRATVTEADLDYVGSVTIDAKLMKEADIKPYEMVQITNLKKCGQVENICHSCAGGIEANLSKRPSSQSIFPGRPGYHTQPGSHDRRGNSQSKATGVFFCQ